ncbi:hypothetical protein B0J11DRAFT_333468 [Dendryphion nanum]|uniref:Uncharacterized protein n=1 Tax=Dendryphion nanum TaxID=256645 RepID=A0A9P9DNP5_9PLEO|nr:hypothetical protein B0J11DRAFT_333468 [Dendryphion nanum]
MLPHAAPCKCKAWTEIRPRHIAPHRYNLSCFLPLCMYNRCQVVLVVRAIQSTGGEQGERRTEKGGGGKGGAQKPFLSLFWPIPSTRWKFCFHHVTRLTNAVFLTSVLLSQWFTSDDQTEHATYLFSPRFQPACRVRRFNKKNGAHAPEPRLFQVCVGVGVCVCGYFGPPARSRFVACSFSKGDTCLRTLNLVCQVSPFEILEVDELDPHIITRKFGLRSHVSWFFPFHRHQFVVRPEFRLGGCMWQGVGSITWIPQSSTSHWCPLGMSTGLSSCPDVQTPVHGFNVY